MTVSYVCDWCGRPIAGEDGRGVAWISASGLHDDWGMPNLSLTYFHAGRHDDEDSCLRQAFRLLAKHCRTSQPTSEEAEAAWKDATTAQRESLLFRVLGDERLTIREMTARLNAELGFPQPDKGWAPKAVWNSNVGSLVKRLLRDGHLEREAETFNKTHTRYRYFRKLTLEGPIGELEQTFRQESGLDREVA